MNKREEFVRFGLGCLGYKSKQDLIEKLYIRSILDSYKRIDKNIGVENDIRDRFIYDFYHTSPYLKKWIQTNIIYVNWERWVFKNDEDLGRTDLSFAISGFEYIVECKRLKNTSQEYVDNGLRRFINGDYCASESYAGMIGFVVNGNAESICRNMETKCKTEKYVSNLFVRKSPADLGYSFKTSHFRKNLPDVNVYHLFLEFVKISN